MRKNGKLINCEICDKPVYIQKYRWSTFRFCSIRCKGKYIMSQHLIYRRDKFCRDMSGKNSPSYKGGFINCNGYKVMSNSGKRCLEHRFIMEKHLGRPLSKFESVHHINHNRSDNRIENLMLMVKKDHDRMHTKENWVKGVYSNIKIYQKGHPYFPKKI